jgi:hypothetical protein
VQKACFQVIYIPPFLLNGQFLGYDTLDSGNFWVQYLENRNHLDEHFDVFRNHMSEHFAHFGCINTNILKAFPHIQPFKKIPSPRTKKTASCEQKAGGLEFPLPR